MHVLSAVQWTTNHRGTPQEIQVKCPSLKWPKETKRSRHILFSWVLDLSHPSAIWIQTSERKIFSYFCQDKLLLIPAQHSKKNNFL